jgi:hypothetical protein
MINQFEDNDSTYLALINDNVGGPAFSGQLFSKLFHAPLP